jgi:hypothetical protein
MPPPHAHLSETKRRQIARLYVVGINIEDDIAMIWA